MDKSLVSMGGTPNVGSQVKLALFVARKKPFTCFFKARSKDDMDRIKTVLEATFPQKIGTDSQRPIKRREME